MATNVPFLDQYEPLDVIGNGSFGIIRKVKRKSDGTILARKELNFERMSERDRKQIVAEVNILKELNHDHIVRYHDRYVDRDAGILYILMEYCGGGDLSTVIKTATKQGRLIPEDTIWNYFLQILLALQHCHHPNISGTSIGGGHTRSGSGSGAAALGMTPSEADAGGSRRAQILHRDLKPDNVFLDENNTVKLGDFGLSKALAQASFANTYVGTPYYMSPELMQEKAYDSKSDIWSLGCLIYELCALKPPFHEAKTHSELSIFIRNGRIPPLPRGYSQALNAVIRSMLNLNPAMRPSAAQLLQHERLELVFKVAETEKMLSIVKSHRSNLANKEREMLAREHAISEKERQLSTILHSKEEEIASLQHMVAQLQAHSETLRVALQEAQQKTGYSQQDVDVAIKNAITRREAELRVLVARQEEQVATAMRIREEEIMEAVRQREREVGEAWMKREEELRGEVVKREEEVREREEEMARREEELARMEDELARREEELTKKEEKKAGGRREKGGVFEEVKNTLPSEEGNTRQFRRAMTTGGRGFGTRQPQPQPTPRPLSVFSRGVETPAMRSAPATTDITPIPSSLSNPSNLAVMPPASAMKGVVFTATGQVLATPLPAAIPMNLATPSPAEIGALFEKSPKVGLGFAKIFDFGKEGEEKVEKLDLNVVDTEVESSEGERDASPPPSPSERRTRVRRQKERVRQEKEEFSDDEQHSTGSGSSGGTTMTTTQRLPSKAELLAPQTKGKPRGIERVMTSSAVGMKQAAAPKAMSRTKSTSSVVMMGSQPPPPTMIRRPSIRTTSGSSNGSSSSGSSAQSVAVNAAASAKRISASRSAGHASNQQTLAVDEGMPASASAQGLPSESTGRAVKPLPHPHLMRTTKSSSNLRAAAAAAMATTDSTNDAPQYDLADEENLPSPFLKRGERSSASVDSTTSVGRLPALSIPTPSSTSQQQSSSTSSSTLSASDAKTKRRGSSGLLLRAAATNAGRRAAAVAAGLVSGGQVSPTADVMMEDGAEDNTATIRERERERPGTLAAHARKTSEERRGYR